MGLRMYNYIEKINITHKQTRARTHAHTHVHMLAHTHPSSLVPVKRVSIELFLQTRVNQSDT